MKNLFLFSALMLFFTYSATAQNYIPFQGVARDSTGKLISNQLISLQISIITGSPTGTVVYTETDTVTTNNLGLFTINIGGGAGVTGTFSSINWGSGPVYVQLGVDPTGGTSYINLGTTQLQSVPYALYAFNASGGGAQPSAQVAYGNSNGNGLTSDGGFRRDSATGTTVAAANPGNGNFTQWKLDSTQYLIINYLNTNNSYNLLLVGDGTNMGFPNSATMLVNFNADSDLVNGFYSDVDSTYLFSGNNDNTNIYGLVGAKHYSSYLDMSYNMGNSLNSLTLDSNGVHWEYNDTDRYTLPLTDGSTGQVLSTNGSGTLGWASVATQTHTVFTPASGDNITAITGTNIINPASAIANLTITLPSSPADNQTVYFTFTNTITLVSFTGGTIAAPLNTISSVSTGALKYWLTYDAATSTWY